jgi:hypothetical protein
VQSGLAVRAELDVPGETRRQTRVFFIWAVCLAGAVLVGSLVGAHVPVSEEGSERAVTELARARSARAKTAFVLGLVLPAAITWGFNRRYRRGGAHARGVVVDVTEDGELRVWGRGYGSRVRLAGATVSERLVDVYAGRLGAWRQRRLRVRGASAGTAVVDIEFATRATAADAEDALRVDGGEGDCVELSREDYEEVRARILELARRV